MKTSIIGYPRVGNLRELKFASEQYFRKEIPSKELQDTASCNYQNLTPILLWQEDIKANKVMSKHLL